jgi:hypothetical protein
MNTSDSLNHEIEIQISELVRDPKLRVRLQSDPDAVAQYRELLSAGVKLPPVKVAQVGEKLLLIDGYMHVEAAESNGQATVPAVIILCSMDDCVRMLITANQTHGLRLTSADKRNGVKIAIAQFTGDSNAVIAKLCCVSVQTVANIRSQILGPEQVAAPRKGLDGKTYARKKGGSEPRRARAKEATNEPKIDILPGAIPEEGEMIEVPIVSLDLDNGGPEPSLEPVNVAALWRSYIVERDRVVAAMNEDVAVFSGVTSKPASAGHPKTRHPERA